MNQNIMHQIGGYDFKFVFSDDPANDAIFSLESYTSDPEHELIAEKVCEFQTYARICYDIQQLMESVMSGRSRLSSVWTGWLQWLVGASRTLARQGYDNLPIDTDMRIFLDRVRCELQHRANVSGEPSINDLHRLKPETKGFVYLLQSPSRAYKIGRTRNPEDRIRTFSIKLPFEVEYISVVETLDMYQLEKDLHLKFEAKRINGEWFNLSAEDIEYIKLLGQVAS